MRSWILLPLLAGLLTIRLRLGNAEGDPLPPSLVSLVRNSSISSLEDLKLLLQQETNAIEDKEDEHDTLSNPTHGRYVRSIVEPEKAERAACKVRTEVMEVTRSMLDRRNANFMLWPPCVEVQRCSGCCNTGVIKCVPIVTSTRYLKVLKIQYINLKPHYENAIISVEDHVTCMCKSSISSSSVISIPRSSSQNNPIPVPPPPQKSPSSHIPMSPPRLAHPAAPHTSKADLHRLDDLKHNQQHYRPQEHEPVARQWQQGGYTQLVHWPPHRVHPATAHVQTGAHQTVTGLSGTVRGWPSEARAEHSLVGSAQQAGHGSGSDRSREEGSVHVSNSGGEVHQPDHEQRQQQLLHHQQRLQHQHRYHQPQYPQQYSHGEVKGQELRTQYRLNAPQSDSSSPPVGLTQLPKFEGNPTPFPSLIQKDSVTSRKYPEVTNDKQTETETVNQKDGNEREESGSAVSADSVGAEPANQGRKKDSKVSSEEGHLTEEERRQKLLEMVRSEPEKTSLHPHYPQHRPKPTPFKTASSVAPWSASARQTPFRPASPRRRRKLRKRMSKAAMRAKILKEMV